MNRIGSRWITVLFLVVTIVLAGCQGAAPAPEVKATSAPKASTEKAAPAEKAAEPKSSEKPAASAKPGAAPTSLPQSTLDYLAKLKKDPSALAGLDDELKVPQEWIDGAKKEGNLTVLHTMDPPQALVLLKPFQERYPFIKVDYNRGADEEKVKAITSAQADRVNTDIIIGVGGHYFIMKENDLAADLREFPTWNVVPEGFKDQQGGWVGVHLRHWAMVYNTTKVKEQDLPKTWDDVLTNPIWRNGNLAVGNRPQLWLLQLWRANGEQWVRNFLDKLFNEVKPQLRKEDINGLIGLAGAGEFYAVIPNGEYRVAQKILDGSPVGFWTPEPIPLSSSELVIFKKAKDPYASRLFGNWLLSKEGQMAQYMAEFAPPVHKDMRSAEWLPFANVILGKKVALRQPEDEETIQPTLLKLWEQMWLKGGGTAR